MLMKRLIIARLVTTLLVTYAIADLSPQTYWVHAHINSFRGEMMSRIIP